MLPYLFAVDFCLSMLPERNKDRFVSSEERVA